jgi:hypothetical protein
LFQNAVQSANKKVLEVQYIFDPKLSSASETFLYKNKRQSIFIRNNYNIILENGNRIDV